ncbi:hypothetical protein ScPMuIL_014080 [Solemya velum]
MRLQTLGIRRTVGYTYCGKVVCVCSIILLCKICLVTRAAVINDTLQTTELHIPTEESVTAGKHTTATYLSSHDSQTDGMVTQKQLLETLYTKKIEKVRDDTSTKATDVYASSSPINSSDISTTSSNIEASTNSSVSGHDTNITVGSQWDGEEFNHSEISTDSTVHSHIKHPFEVTTKSHKKVMDEKLAHDLSLVQHYTEYIKTNWFAGKHKNHPVDHHLNLIPIEDGPFGSLIWRDKKYLISVLIPIGVGIAGAVFIVVMAYAVRYCHRGEHASATSPVHIPEVSMKSSPQTDEVILLADSTDDEF